MAENLKAKDEVGDGLLRDGVSESLIQQISQMLRCAQLRELKIIYQFVRQITK